MFNCPRCELQTKDSDEQLQRCAFCRQRAKEMTENFGKCFTVSPTDQYPAGRNANS